jgi:hypothetical protein
MTSETWSAAALAAGMWIIAAGAVIGSDARTPRADGVLWTVASSDKVASHPTLVRRALPDKPASVRTASLDKAQ